MKKIRQIFIIYATQITALFLASLIYFVTYVAGTQLSNDPVMSHYIGLVVSGICLFWTLKSGSGAEATICYYLIRPDDIIVYATPIGIQLGVVDGIPTEIILRSGEVYQKEWLSANKYIVVVRANGKDLVSAKHIKFIGTRQKGGEKIG